MCSTHDVNCKKCGERIAWWSMFDNIQHQSEWECSGLILDYRYNPDLKKNEVIGNRLLLDRLDTYLKLKNISRRDWSYCSIINHTVFCEKCAKKLKFICPDCGSTIIQTRNRDGYTIHE